MTVFFNGEYVNLEKPHSILFYTNLGYSHIWNQYENGKGSEMLELGLSYNQQFFSDHLYFRGGFGTMHQHAFFKFGAGYRF